MASVSGPNKKLIKSNSGRFPWYKVDGSVCEPYIIGIAGGSASGKTSVGIALFNRLSKTNYFSIGDSMGCIAVNGLIL